MNNYKSVSIFGKCKNIPDDFKVLKLKDIIIVDNKMRKAISQKNRIKGCYPYCGATKIQDYIENYCFDGRRLLIGEDGAEWGGRKNTTYIMNGKFNVNNHAHVLKEKDVPLDFLKYYLNYNDLSYYITGSVIKKLTKENLLNIDVFFDEKNINKIVHILNTQENLIILYEEKLSILKQQESYYQDELLSGRLRIKLNDSSIKEIIEKGWYHENDIIEGKEEEFEKWISEDFDKKIVFYKEENTIEKNIDNNIRSLSSEWIEKKLIDLSNITTGKLNANAKVDNGKYRFYTCAENHFFIDKYCFDTEAILISGNGSNVGHINYYKGKFNAYQRTYVLKDFSLSAIYIKKYLDNYLKLRINSEMRAANIPYIVFDTLSNMKIFIPPKNIEVLIINNFLNIFTNQRSLIEEKIEIEEKKMEYLTEELLSGKTRVE